MKLPDPGELRHPARIPVAPAELQALLLNTAGYLSLVECPLDEGGDCEGCRAVESLWWHLYNMLEAHERKQLIYYMSVRAIPAPELWEDVWSATDDERN